MKKNEVYGKIARIIMNKFLSFLKEFLETIALVVLVVIPIRIFLFQPFLVRGASMEPNFHSGEYLIIDQLTYRFRDPQRGEVIVFKNPKASGYYFIKRIIGLPKETVEIKDNKVILYNDKFPQGKVLEESYASGETYGDLKVTLKEDEYFVLGDNREHSSDSRTWGPISRKNIVGKVLVGISFKEGIEIFKPPIYEQTTL